MNVLKTDRLLLRELDSAQDAEFVFDLLNSPKFLRYIGDRGVRSVDQAADFIENRYRASYRDNGYGLYLVERKTDAVSVGICGFVRRDYFEFPDIGFAFSPQFERQGYGFESAGSMMAFGRERLGFTRILAITSPDNDVSGKLLEKLGFSFDRLFSTPEGDEVKLFQIDL